MAYSHELIGNIGVADESNSRYRNGMNIGVGIDSLGMCTISFGSSFAIRIPEADVDKLRDILHDASRKMNVQRYDREVEAAMSKLQNVNQETA